jgi:hypothetical protein
MINGIRLVRNFFQILIRNPLFSMGVILILGLGIGINTGVFCLIKTTLLNPLPFRQPDRIVAIRPVLPNMGETLFSYPVFNDLERSQRCLNSVGAVMKDYVDLSLNGQRATMRLGIVYGSSGIFKVSGLPFILGHPFTEQEDQPRGGRS